MVYVCSFGSSFFLIFFPSSCLFLCMVGRGREVGWDGQRGDAESLGLHHTLLVIVVFFLLLALRLSVLIKDCDSIFFSDSFNGMN